VPHLGHSKVRGATLFSSIKKDYQIYMPMTMELIFYRIEVMYKKIIEGKKAVFFDLDGTVVDNSSLWAEAFHNVLEGIGVRGVSKENAFTPGVADQWKLLLHKYKIKTDKSIEELSQEADAEYVRLLADADLEAREGFWDFLYEIKEEKKLKVALLTNSVKNVAYQTLKKINAENSFDLIIYGDEIKKPKPDPEIYKTALERMLLKPEEVLVFEDSPTGTKSANMAELEIIVILDGNFLADMYKGRVYFTIQDFTPLPNHLDYTYEEWINTLIKTLADKEKKLEETKASDIS
jgi:HAD superfamily hydrolase (TIGR01509 family)